MLIVYSEHGRAIGMCVRYQGFMPSEDEILVLSDRFPEGATADVTFTVPNSDCLTDHQWIDALVAREERAARMIEASKLRQEVDAIFRPLWTGR